MSDGPQRRPPRPGSATTAADSGPVETAGRQRTEPALAVVIPVRNGAELAATCLRPIAAQLRADDELIVVDDASTDASADVAASFGATVIRRSSAGGPYVARNDGWRAASAPVVVFTDIRCRARDDWLRMLRSGFTPPPPAMVCCDVHVMSGPRLAERVAHKRQHLLAQRYVDNAWKLPYYPTASLAVRRDALDAVGGFRAMLSGGDADLCWRIQLAGHGDLRVAPGVGMDWQPRSTIRELLQQRAKYGASAALLRRDYPELYTEQVTPVGRLRLTLRSLRGLVHALRDRESDSVALTGLNAMTTFTYYWAFHSALRRLTSDRTGALDRGPVTG